MRIMRICMPGLRNTVGLYCTVKVQIVFLKAHGPALHELLTLSNKHAHKKMLRLLRTSALRPLS